MRTTLFFALILASTNPTLAQRNQPIANDTSIRSIDLGEVVVKSVEPEKVANRVRSQNVSIMLSPTTGNSDQLGDSTYFVTKFEQPEQDPIFLHSVELKLKQYDTSMFDVKLLIYQLRPNDTLHREVIVDGSQIDKKGKIRVLLFDKDINLQPGIFYIGYGFHRKNIDKMFEYRLYCSNKGEGALLTFRNNSVKLTSDPHLPYVFPFKIAYRKL